MSAHNILVIEDNVTTRKVVRLTLGNEGFAVVEAATGADALAMVAQARPDLVLQDLLLPDMDGFDLVARLRALPELEGVPIVAFSGFLSRLEFGRATAMGFSDFLPKPVEPSRLVHVVRTHLPQAIESPAAISDARRILLVDDDPVQLKVARLRLRTVGFVVETATDGVEALDALRHGGFDAVLSDVLMPRLDGFRLCAAMRRDPELARLPVVLASSNYVEDADRALARHVGASALIARTPDLGDAITALTAALTTPPDPAPSLSADTYEAEHHGRVVYQLERQAMMNAVYTQRASMHAAMLSVLAGMSETITRHASVEHAVPDILSSLLDASGVSRGALYLVTDGRLFLGATLGFASDVAAKLRGFCGEPAAFDQVVARRAPVVVVGTDRDPAMRSVITQLAVGSVLLIPLTSGADCLGLLVLASQTRDLTGRDWMPFARMISVQIGQGLALGNAFRTVAASEQRYRTLLERATESILTIELDGRIQDVNPEAERFLGRPRAALIGASVFELLVPDQRAAGERDFGALVGTGRIAVEGMRFQRPDGDVVIADISATVVELDGARFVLSIWRDVTERTRAQRELRLLQDLTVTASAAADVPSLFDAVLRMLGEAGDWVFGAAWRPHAASGTLICEHVWTAPAIDRAHVSSLASLTFSPGEGILGRAWATRNAIWTRDLAREVGCPRSAVASQVGLHAGLVTPVIAQGEVIALIELFGASPADDPRFVELVSTAATQLASVIERKRAREALVEAEGRFSRLWESGIVGVAIADIGGNTHEANDAYLGMIGFSRAELEAGQVRWLEMTPAEWRASDETATEQLMARGQTLPWEKELFRKDGSRVPVLIGVATLGPDRVIAVISDLTERRRAEEALRRTDEQLRQSQKMEAVGRLAGGVAHDFNNALSVVISYGELLLADLHPGEPMREDVEEICKAGQRAAGLTRQLLMFSRQQVMEPRVLNLNEVVLGLEKMLQRLVGADVELTCRVAPSLGRVRIDPGSMEQVLMNLVVNARDAMPTGGLLSIETANVMLDDEYCRHHAGTAPGPYVMLAVTDNGIGMDRATQERIFEPFFTTKEAGKGTGLGLATVFGIVQQSGGSIWVYSEPGHGTTFKIHLPRVDARTDTGSINVVVPLDTRGTETILLVEDEDQVRVVARGILRRYGYKVIEARNAGEALLLTETAPSIDLLLSDVVMPQMSGPALAKRLAVSRPEMKVVCMSGYTDDSVVRHGVLDASIAYLQKPFTPETLTRKVREVLDSARTGHAVRSSVPDESPR